MPSGQPKTKQEKEAEQKRRAAEKRAADKKSDTGQVDPKQASDQRQQQSHQNVVTKAKAGSKGKQAEKIDIARQKGLGDGSSQKKEAPSVTEFDIIIYKALFRRLGCIHNHYPQFKAEDSSPQVSDIRGRFFRSKTETIMMVKGIVNTWPGAGGAAALADPVATDPNAECIKIIKDFIIGMFSDALHTTEGGWNTSLGNGNRTLNRGAIEELNYRDHNTASLTLLRAAKYKKDSKEYQIIDSSANKKYVSELCPTKKLILIKTQDRTPYFTGAVLGYSGPIHLYSHHHHRSTSFNEIGDEPVGTNKIQLRVICDFLMHKSDIDFDKTIRDGILLDSSLATYQHGHIRAAGKFISAFQSFRVVMDTIKMILFSDFPLLYDAIKCGWVAVNFETVYEYVWKNESNYDDAGSIGMLEILIIRLSAFFLCSYHNLTTITNDDNIVQDDGTNERLTEICSEISRFKKRLLPYNRFFYNPDGTTHEENLKEHLAEDELFKGKELSKIHGDKEMIDVARSLSTEEKTRKIGKISISAGEQLHGASMSLLHYAEIQKKILIQSFSEAAAAAAREAARAAAGSAAAAEAAAEAAAAEAAAAEHASQTENGIQQVRIGIEGLIERLIPIQQPTQAGQAPPPALVALEKAHAAYAAAREAAGAEAAEAAAKEAQKSAEDSVRLLIRLVEEQPDTPDDIIQHVSLLVVKVIIYHPIPETVRYAAASPEIAKQNEDFIINMVKNALKGIAIGALAKNKGKLAVDAATHLNTQMKSFNENEGDGTRRAAAQQASIAAEAAVEAAAEAAKQAGEYEKSIVDVPYRPAMTSYYYHALSRIYSTYTNSTMKQMRDIAFLCNYFLSVVDYNCNPVAGEIPIKEYDYLTGYLDREVEAIDKKAFLIEQETLSIISEAHNDLKAYIKTEGDKVSTKVVHILSQDNLDVSQSYLKKHRGAIVMIRGLLDYINRRILSNFNPEYYAACKAEDDAAAEAPLRGAQSYNGHGEGIKCNPATGVRGDGTGPITAGDFHRAVFPKKIVELPDKITRQLDGQSSEECSVVFEGYYDSDSNVVPDKFTKNFSKGKDEYNEVAELYKDCSQYVVSTRSDSITDARDTSIPKYIMPETAAAAEAAATVHRGGSGCAEVCMESYFKQCGLDITKRSNKSLLELSVICQKSFIDFYDTQVKKLGVKKLQAQQTNMYKDGKLFGVALSRFENNFHRDFAIRDIAYVVDNTNLPRDMVPKEKIEILMGGIYILKKITIDNRRLRNEVNLVIDRIIGYIRRIRYFSASTSAILALEENDSAAYKDIHTTSTRYIDSIGNADMDTKNVVFDLGVGSAMIEYTRSLFDNLISQTTSGHQGITASGVSSAASTIRESVVSKPPPAIVTEARTAADEQFNADSAVAGDAALTPGVQQQILTRKEDTVQSALKTKMLGIGSTIDGIIFSGNSIHKKAILESAFQFFDTYHLDSDEIQRLMGHIVSVKDTALAYLETRYGRPPDMRVNRVIPNTRLIVSNMLDVLLSNLVIAPDAAVVASNSMYRIFYDDISRVIGTHEDTNILTDMILGNKIKFTGVDPEVIYSDRLSEEALSKIREIKRLIDDATDDPIKAGYIHTSASHLLPFLSNFVLGTMKDMNIPVPPTSMAGGKGEYIVKEVSLVLSDVQSTLPKRGGVIIQLVYAFLTIFMDNPDKVEFDTTEFSTILSMFKLNGSYKRFKVENKNPHSPRTWAERGHNHRAQAFLVRGNNKLMELILGSFSGVGFSIWSMQRKIVAMFSRLAKEMNIMIADVKQDKDILDLVEHVYTTTPLGEYERLKWFEDKGLYNDPPLGYNIIMASQPDVNIPVMEKYMSEYKEECFALGGMFKIIEDLISYYQFHPARPIQLTETQQRGIVEINTQKQLGLAPRNVEIIWDDGVTKKFLTLIGDLSDIKLTTPKSVQVSLLFDSVTTAILGQGDILASLKDQKRICFGFIYKRITDIECLLKILTSANRDGIQAEFYTEWQEFIVAYNAALGTDRGTNMDLTIFKTFPFINECGNILDMFHWVKSYQLSDIEITHRVSGNVVVHAPTVDTLDVKENIRKYRRLYDAAIVTGSGREIERVKQEMTPSLYRSIVSIINKQISLYLKVDGYKNTSQIFTMVKDDTQLMNEIIGLINKDYANIQLLYGLIPIEKAAIAMEVAKKRYREYEMLLERCNNGFCSGLYQPAFRKDFEQQSQDMDYGRTISFMLTHRDELITYIHSFGADLYEVTPGVPAKYKGIHINKMTREYYQTREGTTPYGPYGFDFDTTLRHAVTNHLIAVGATPSLWWEQLLNLLKWFVTGWNIAVDDLVTLSDHTRKKVKQVLAHVPIIEYFIHFIKSDKIRTFIKQELFGMDDNTMFNSIGIEIYIIGRLCGKIFGQLLSDRDNPMQKIQCAFPDIEYNKGMNATYLITSMEQRPVITQESIAQISQYIKEQLPIYMAISGNPANRVIMMARNWIESRKHILNGGLEINRQDPMGIEDIRRIADDAARASADAARAADYADLFGDDGGSGGGGRAVPSSAPPPSSASGARPTPPPQPYDGGAALLPSPYNSRGGSIRKLENKSIMKPRKMSKCKNNKYKRVKTRRKLKSKRKNKRYKKVKTIRNIKRK